jgi:glutathione S-transferase
MEILPKIYGSVISPFVRKALIVFYFKNIHFEVETLIPFVDSDKEKILQQNPLGKVPIYQEGDFVISDSSVICAYLDKKYPNPSIYPDDVENFARCLWYEEYADTQLIPALARVFFHTCVAARLHRPADMNVVKMALDVEIPKIFDYIDREILHKKYLVNDRLSLADISMASAFINFEFSENTIDAVRWPNLARYVEEISKEECIAKAFSEAKKRFTEWVK